MARRQFLSRLAALPFLAFVTPAFSQRPGSTVCASFARRGSASGAGLGHEVWIGDATQIRASYVRKQKTDRRDAAHILKLLLENRFPRLWRPSAEQRDLRQLLIHRDKLVGIRARVKNGLQHLMLNRGVQMKRKLWSRAALAGVVGRTDSWLGSFRRCAAQPSNRRSRSACCPA